MFSVLTLLILLTSPCISRVCFYIQRLDLAVLINFNAYIEHVVLQGPMRKINFKLFKK